MNPDLAVRLCEAELYLQLLRSSAPPGGLLDVRYRTRGHQLARCFLGLDTPQAARALVTLGAQTDVYVGCAMRVRRRGRREDVAPTALLWADCDDLAASATMHAFAPPPSMIVASGSPANTHAYWALTHPLPTEELEYANHRLAQALGADPHCADAARILRVPGTLNHKHDPPRPVRLLDYSPTRYRPVELYTALPPISAPGTLTPPAPHALTAPMGHWLVANPSIPGGAQAAQHSPGAHVTTRAKDPLHEIEPAHYVRLLTGRTPAPNGKLLCPLHEERTPSFHAYPTPQQGWACYGCPTPTGRPRGGDIYTLASHLWNIPTRGQSFTELRARLHDVFRVHRA